MRELVFFLEEESAKALLVGLLPRLIPSDIAPRFLVFERKLRGYLNPHARFIVLRDQDDSDCRKTKRKLAAICSKAGKTDTTIRIACRALEAFYLGDLRAVEIGLGVKDLSGKQSKAKYRDPDRLHTPSLELAKLTGNQYQKVAGSRAISPHLSIDAARSRSFQHLIQAVVRAGGELMATGAHTARTA